jgi:hypothetical protein
MATARQHHYVQARYLDGFLAPGSTQLVCYGRGRSKPHRSIPDGIATQRDFYAIPNGPPDANIENFLETKIERPGLDALRRLVENRTPPSLEDRVSLSRYIAFQEMRVPYSRELNREHMRQSLEEKALQTAPCFGSLTIPAVTTHYCDLIVPCAALLPAGPSSSCVLISNTQKFLPRKPPKRTATPYRQ